MEERQPPIESSPFLSTTSDLFLKGSHAISDFQLKDPTEICEITWLKANIFMPKINLHMKGAKAIRKTEDKGNGDQLAN